MKCKHCNKYFNYNSFDIGEYCEYKEEGYCTHLCMLKGMPQDKYIEYCFNRFGFPDNTEFIESNNNYIIIIPKVYPFKRN